MNLFKAISVVLDSAVNTVVTSSNAINRVVVTADNYVSVAELHSVLTKDSYNLQVTDELDALKVKLEAKKAKRMT